MLKKLRKNFENFSIKKKLNYTRAIIIIIPFLVLGLFVNKVSSDNIIEKTKADHAQNLLLIDQGLKNFLNSSENLSRIPVTSSIIQEALIIKTYNKADISNINREYILRTNIDGIIEPKNILSSMVIYGNNGMVLGSGGINTNQIHFSDIKNNYMMKVLETKGKPVWFDTRKINYFIDNPNLNCISLFRSIMSNVDGSHLGYLEVNITEQSISNVYSNYAGGGTVNFMIINSDGEIISSQKKEELYTNISNEKFFQDLRGTQKQNGIYEIGKEKFLVTSIKIDMLDWYVAEFVPLNEITNDVNKVTFLIFLTGILCLGLVFSSSRLITKSIINPIICLNNAMNSAAQGNMRVKAEIRGNDEVTNLSRTFNYMIERISELMDQVYKEQKMKREFEFLALQAQINPHFLYNTLESICSLAILERKNDVVKMVKSLAVFYRITLSNGRNIISLRDEIENIRNYLTIQQIRYQETLSYEISADDNILDYKITKLTIQPLAENAIYHGLKNKRNGGTIKIIVESCTNEMIRISVCDDGVGFNADKIKEEFLTDNVNQHNKRFGLESTYNRLKLYFGETASIKINSKIGEGTKIDIYIPKKS